MKYKIEGRLIKLEDNVNTDVIIPGRYLIYTEPEDLAKYAFEPLGEDFRENLKRSQILIAGQNFGCGSAREQAATAIKAMGIEVVIACSFARTFFRNAINSGLPAIQCPPLYDLVEDGEIITVDLKKMQIITKKESLTIQPIHPMIFKILQAGGLFEYLKAEFSKKNPR